MARYHAPSNVVPCVDTIRKRYRETRNGLMRCAIIIPARYESERLPGKPIRPEIKEGTGKYLIQHVYERARRAKQIQHVLVATDDERIRQAVIGFGGQAVMTSRDHASGTDRIAEAAQSLDVDLVVNVQGDEPEIQPEMIETVAEMLREDPDASMSTLANEIREPAEYADPAAVKVVVDNRGYALYFSRAPIPHVRGAHSPVAEAPLPILKHLGIYGYRKDFLLSYSSLPPAPLEQAEKLEQLRALANGYRIRVGVTPHRCAGIDTYEDMERFIAKFSA